MPSRMKLSRSFNQAREPKKLVILPGGHFGAYTGPDFEASSGAARDWFVQHLLNKAGKQAVHA